MFGFTKPSVANFRADYAGHNDFCHVFKRDMKALYLLAFLLTGNHKESEQCFVDTIEEAFKKQAVFKDWVESWVRRSLIKNAIHVVSPSTARNGEKRDLWGVRQGDTQRECEIDTVTKLDPLERFVFVMSILEHHSDWECARLLGCKMDEVAQLQMKALCCLADFGAVDTPFNGHLLPSG